MSVEKIVFKSGEPVDIIVYGDRLEDHSNFQNCVFIYDDQVSIDLKMSDIEISFHTQGYLSVIKLDEMKDAIDKAHPSQFSVMDNYEDYGDDEDIDVWDLGMMVIKNFVGEIKYSGQILGTGNCDDFDHWNKMEWKEVDLNNARLTIPVKSDKVEQLPLKLLKIMGDKWWSQ